MRYLLLLYGDHDGERSLSPDERQAIVEQHIDLSRRMRERGVLVESDALTGPGESKLIRLDADQPLVTDGPFAETKEQLGGFYLIECDGLEEALRWAEQVPRSPGLVAELRPLAGV